MKTIQMTIEQDLLSELDQLVEQMHTTRSAFMREALRVALHRFKIRELERQHVAAYAAQPQTLDEIEIWQSEQDWGDDWIEQPIKQKVSKETW